MDRPVVSIEALSKTFGSAVAVSNFNLQIFRGEIVGLLGPSGCGKTTTLRCVAGLEKPSSGTIVGEGRTLDSSNAHLPTEQRGMGMVFQSYALWPHLTVAQNVEFPLSYLKKKTSTAERRRRVHETLSLLNLEPLSKRYPAELSGGQQQRVAVARALVTEPAVLLFDEPFSNLDARLRNQLRIDLRLLLKRINATALYVTHDQREAMALCDRIAIMDAGSIRQSGTPWAIYKEPADLFVATFMGDSTALSFSVTYQDGPSGTSRILVEDAVEADVPASIIPSAGPGVRGTVVLRPDALELCAEAPADRQHWSGTILERIYLGLTSEYVVALADGRVTLTVTALEMGDQSLPAGTACFIVPRVKEMLFYLEQHRGPAVRQPPSVMIESGRATAA